MQLMNKYHHIVISTSVAESWLNTKNMQGTVSFAWFFGVQLGLQQMQLVNKYHHIVINVSVLMHSW